MSVDGIKATTDCDYHQERDFVCCSSEDFVFQLAQTCKKKTRLLDKNKILVKVLLGGSEGHQQTFLRLAKNYMNEHHRDVYDLLEFDERNNDQMKQEEWDPDAAVNWLIDSDIHVHQGMTGLPGQEKWNINSIESNFWRLKCHSGFPNDIYLKCRIFLQDKWGYLVAVKDRVLPTLKVPLIVNIYDNTIIERITK